ncbi:MAG: hypothetical protein ACFFD4_01635 [Candidatus Odinarchaeota archaeon]
MPQKRIKVATGQRQKTGRVKIAQRAKQQQSVTVFPAEKSHFVQELLLWFDTNKRSFFWREQKLEPFQYALIEILLQKTRAVTVEAFVKDFLTRYPSPEQLNGLSLEKLENLIKPLGLHKQRAVKIKRLAEEILESGDDRLATDSIYNLPGIGDYIGRMTRIMAYGHVLAIIDTNVVRILKRVFGLITIQDARRDKQLIKLAEEMLEMLLPSTIKEYSLALLDFGALVCLPRKPECEKGIACPLMNICHYYDTTVAAEPRKDSQQ